MGGAGLKHDEIQTLHTILLFEISLPNMGPTKLADFREV
jgi:hypothetical protein